MSVVGLNVGLGIIGWISTIVIFVAYFPGTIKIIMSHQTFFLSMGMWIMTMCSLFCFVIYGGFLGGQAQMNHWGAGAEAAGYALVIFDGINFILCGIILLYKINNQHIARRDGISEQQVCENYLKQHPGRVKNA